MIINNLILQLQYHDSYFYWRSSKIMKNMELQYGNAYSIFV